MTKKHKNSITLDEFLCENLKDQEMAKEFLNVSLESYFEDGNFEEFLRSLEYVIKANQSVSSFAKEARINRAHLYSIFKNEKKPKFDTVITILSKLGFQIKVA
jgi:probable addiction module antidote protein